MNRATAFQAPTVEGNGIPFQLWSKHRASNCSTHKPLTDGFEFGSIDHGSGKCGPSI